MTQTQIDAVQERIRMNLNGQIAGYISRYCRGKKPITPSFCYPISTGCDDIPKEAGPLPSAEIERLPAFQKLRRIYEPLGWQIRIEPGGLRDFWGWQHHCIIFLPQLFETKPEFKGADHDGTWH